MIQGENKMAEDKKKKSIFDQAIDALTNRDEKAAAEAAAKDAAAKAAAAKDELAKQMAAKAAAAQAEAERIKKAAMDSELAKKAAAEQARLAAELAAKKEQAAKDMAAMAEKAKAEFAAKVDALEKAKIIKHVWTKEDTYASLAQKYYGSFKEPYWRLIYEHNKAIIGNHPNDIRNGLEIEIPPLPDELKNK